MFKSYEQKNIIYQKGEGISPSFYSKENIEKLAEFVGKETGLTIGGDIQKMVEEVLGGKVHLTPIHQWTEPASIYVHGENDFDIVTEAAVIEARRRFTIAHELGHYFLHSTQGEIPIIANRLGSGRLEWEANWFAAALLMPAAVFKKAVKKDSDVVNLAGQFQVSFSAIEIRKKQFNL